MKKIYFFWFIIMLCFISLNAYTQNIGDLKGINYQAVAVDEEGKEIVGMDIEGKPLYKKALGVKFTITQGLDGQVQYEEIHTTNTDKYGLFSLTIGQGEQTGGTYDHLMEIPWIDADQFLKVEISINNDGNYRMVSNQQFMTVPYSFYTDDIADNAITTEKILDHTILNEDIATGSVDTRTILDETILNEDIATGSVDTRTILDHTIQNEDIDTGSVDTRTILDHTIQNEDIDTGSVDTRTILDHTILNEDIANEAINSRTIEEESILNEDIATGAIDTRLILDETILNEDIADGTIDLTTKVTGVLPAEHGGTGESTLTDGGLLIGGGDEPIRALPQADDGQITVGITDSDPVLKNLTAGSGIQIDQEDDDVIIRSTISGEVEADGIKTINIGTIPAGETYTSPAFDVPGEGSGEMGDIILASIDKNLQGCMLTPYFFSSQTVKIAIFNGTGNAVNLGNDVTVKLLIVQ